MTVPPHKPTFDEDRALQLLLQGTMGETGREFFRALVRNVAEAFGVDGAWVTEFDTSRNRLSALAFWHKGEYVENFSHDLKNTPCEHVIADGNTVHIPDRIIDLYPLDPDLRTADAVSYLGVPMKDAAGMVIGHLAAVHTQPLPHDARLISLFEIFALRASAELQRLRGETQFQQLNDEATALRDIVHALPETGDIIGESKPVRVLRDGIARVAPTDATVLILGETGTGKELVARAIHHASRRAAKPMVRVNCAAIPPSLIESEFFGHERGAFTGAVARREGRFAAADDSTIFLDEIGEMPLDLQPKLLRVLQEGEFEMVGSTRTRKVDVRVLAATNVDLCERTKRGEFREDLYYRLCVFPLSVPPLRERGDDICMLAQAFALRFAAKLGMRTPALADADRAVLKAYQWPGNVRELQNVIERAMILGTGQTWNLHRAMPSNGQDVPDSESGDTSQTPILTAEQLRMFEKRNIERALEHCAGKVSGDDGAAALLGLPASTLSSRMKALGIATRRA